MAAVDTLSLGTIQTLCIWVGLLRMMSKRCAKMVETRLDKESERPGNLAKAYCYFVGFCIAICLAWLRCTIVKGPFDIFNWHCRKLYIRSLKEF